MHLVIVFAVVTANETIPQNLCGSDYPIKEN